MLRKLTNMTLAAAIGAAAMTAAPALADGTWNGREHTVIMLGTSYFPTISYIDQGDRIRFVNESDTDQIATAENGIWTTGILAPGETATVQIEQGLAGRYFGDAEMTIEGKSSFGTPPLEN